MKGRTVPPLYYLDIDGQSVDPYTLHFEFIDWNHIHRKDDLRKLARLPNLKSARFCKTNLDDVGLEHISHAATLENLDLQNTKISNVGLTHLRRLPRLHSLQLYETAIDERGLASLEGMTNLRNILVDVKEDNYTFDGLLALSARMPQCTIHAKGRGNFLRGQFNGIWMATAQEWLASTDPQEMLQLLRGKASDRKVRLFAVACCLRVWKSLKLDEFRIAVEVAEKFADGRADEIALTQARRAALAVFADLSGNDNGPGAALSAAGIPSQSDSSTGKWWQDEFDRGDPMAPALLTSTQTARAVVDEQNQSLAFQVSAMSAEYRRQAELIRCIFGNPFSPIALNFRWLASTVVDLAQTVYEDKAFDRLPILADALMDAGCDSEEIFNHCRGPEPHVRGCWVVDLLLGKN
jgi:hypothetical protein